MRPFAIFLSGLLLLIVALPIWRALRARPKMAAELAGVNAAVVGLLASALYSPVWTSAVYSLADFTIAATAFSLQIRSRIAPLAIVAAVRPSRHSVSALGKNRAWRSRSGRRGLGGAAVLSLLPERVRSLI